MSRNDDDRSNPIMRAFSKFLERGDVSKPKEQTRDARPVPATRTTAAPAAAVARATGATTTATSRSTAPGTLASGATQRATGSSTGPAAPRRTYTVQKGDSLSKIAQQTYGRADRWQAIFDANRDQIDDPDLIHPGQTLVLPDLPKLH
jgi:nucleoid-associated protein YgaU